MAREACPKATCGQTCSWRVWSGQACWATLKRLWQVRGGLAPQKSKASHTKQNLPNRMARMCKKRFCGRIFKTTWSICGNAAWLPKLADHVVHLCERLACAEIQVFWPEQLASKDLANLRAFGELRSPYMAFFSRQILSCCGQSSLGGQG